MYSTAAHTTAATASTAPPSGAPARPAEQHHSAAPCASAAAADAPGADASAASAADAASSAAAHELCLLWGAWASTALQYHGAPVLPHARRHLLTRRTRPVQDFAGGLAHACDDAPRAHATSPAPTASAPAHHLPHAMMCALHLAIVTEPATALDRRAFELHYLWAVRDIKRSAAELGIGRQHWYRVVAAFRARVMRRAMGLVSGGGHGPNTE